MVELGRFIDQLKLLVLEIDVASEDAFASKLVPTGCSLAGTEYVYQPGSPVGASLLAKVVCLAKRVLDVMAPSRASPLPHEALLGTGYVYQPRSPVGAGLLAKAVCLAKRMLDVTALSRASPLPQGGY
ncbi:hypothetical protein AL066_13045 [Pseudomonas nunensis]|nr:hypothetical protein AL066_13045 [Pseudomonas nunensis]